MIQIQLSDATLVLGARRIFEGLNWEIQRGQKIGLIGPNGAGKSSLFKLIQGEYSPELGGSLTRARGLTTGYLPQQPELDLATTALDAALQSRPRVAELQRELEQVEASLGESSVYEDPKKLQRALERQQTIHGEYEELGGDRYPELVRRMLSGLGLAETDIGKPLSVLSGGQKKLVGLARLMLSGPDVLLLDEPDNHLDLPGKIFLETFVRDYDGTVVIISHDRYLLDAAITHIAEIEDGRLHTFAGNYTDYVLDKEERLARQQQLYEIQQRAIQRMQMALKRYQQWVLLNDKFASRLHAMEARIARVERIAKPELERRVMDLELAGWRGSNKVLDMRDVSKSFDHRALFSGVKETIWHGERVGLIGPNGAGKSVLLRMILGQENVDAGEIRVGPSVRIGHYSQEHETLDFDQTVLEAVRYAGEMSESSATSFLLRYLFTYRQATQKIGSLSGGERSRLQLALLVLSGANFLLLDEPTNNLDILSAEVLEQALAEFEGTALIISHDRYFLDRTVQRMLVIEGGRLNNYHGGYTDYLDARGRSSSPT